MDNASLDNLLAASESLKKWAAGFGRRRYIYAQAMAVGRDYFAGIAGMRGIGKTVVLLQMANETEKSVYLSADASYLQGASIYDTVKTLERQGFSNIFIDEIHTKPDWASELKTIYDEHEVRVFFSGSSSIKIRQSGADLSRRAVILEMKGTSYREYLLFSRSLEIPAYPFGDVVRNKRELALANSRASGFMEDYARFGGVLYSGEGFSQALQNSLEKIISVDLASLRDMNLKYRNDAYNLLYLIANGSPYEFSYNSVSQKLGVSKTFLIRLLSDLQRLGLVKALLPCKREGVDVKKEPKVYLATPYRSLLCRAPDMGALREEFFVNNAPVSCYYKTMRGEKTADFSVEGKVVEVGGFGKKMQQTPDIIAADGLNTEGNHVPLFLFGFLY